MMAETIRVLYVDDEPLLLDVGKQFLEQSGDFTVTTALSASEAIRILGQERFDAIVSDYQMPEMDGIEFLKHIKAKGNTTPFIILTGKGYEKVVIEALDAGADFYIQKGGKPKSHFAELSHKIKKAVESRQVEAALRESEEKLRSLFQILPVGVTILDKNRNIVNVNPALERILSFSKEELMRRDHRQRRHIRSDGTPMPPEEYASSRAIAGQTVVSGVETGVVKEDGSIIWTSVSAAPLAGNAESAVIITTDITERKQVEEALRESKRELTDIINFLPDATLVIDKNGTVLAWNQAMVEMTGVPAEQMIGKANYEYALPFYHERRPITIDLVLHDDPAVAAKYPVMKKEGNSLLSEIFIPHLNNGRGAHLWFTASPLYDADGNISGAIESIRDITERKRMEEALRESKDRYHSLFEGVSIGLYRTTPSGQILDVNPALVHLLGYPDRELLMAVSVPDLYMNPLEHTHWLALIEREGIVHDFEVQFRTYDGTIIWVRDTGDAIHDDSGQVIYYNGNVEDITERKRAEETLRESEERYRNVVEDQTELICRFLPNGTHIFVNEAYCRYFDKKREEIVGHRFKPVLHPEDREIVARHIASLTSLNPVMNIDQRIIMSDSSTRWQRWSDRAIFHADGSLKEYQSVGRDITDRKQDEEALRETNEYLHKLIDFGNAPIIIWNPEFEITLFNQASGHLTGMIEQEVIGQKIDILFPADSREASLALIKKTLEGERWETVEIPILASDGTIRTVLWNTANILTAEAELISTFAQGVDITERKQVEETLRESEKKFRSLVEHALEGIMVLDLQGTILFANNAMARTLEVDDRAGLIGRNVMEFVAPESRDDVVKDFIEVSQGHDAYLAQYNTISAKGNNFTVESIGKVIRYEGKPADLVSIRDITERKQVEVALRESRDRFEVTLASLDDAVILVDPATRLISECNDATTRIFGYSHDELVGRETNFLHVDLAHVEQFEREAGATYEDPGYYTREFEMRRKDGSVFPTEHFVRPVRNPDGRILYVVSVVRDITRRKRVDEALVESEERYRLLAEHMTDIVWLMDMDIKTTYQSPSSEKLRGYTSEEIKDLPLEKNLTPESLKLALEVFFKEIPRIEADPGYNPVIRLELEYYRKDGTTFWSENKFSTIRDGSGKPVSILGEGRDITERKQAEDTIKSALAEKEVLLREIHHRVKNNLAGIISLIDLQIGSVSDPVTITLLKDLEARIRSMALVHESLYRTEDLTHISFTNYTEDLTWYLFQAYGLETDIRCRIDMGDVTMPIETAIPCGLVMSEIVTNSLKYAFPHTFSCGEIRGEPCTIALSLHREGNDYLLKITDNGTGIPEGIGVTMSHSLGLFLIRFIVEHQLRGSLEVSTAGGTAYTIRFPAPEVKERNNDE